MDGDFFQYISGGFIIPLLKGLYVTVSAGLVSFALSVTLGLALSVVLSETKLIKPLWRIYRSIITGVPALLVVFFVYYNLPGWIAGLYGTSVEIGPWTAGITALTFVYTVYVAELSLLAVQNSGRAAREAAEALGLRLWSKWTIVLLPQVIRLSLPGLSNLFINIVKDTSLLSLVGLSDVVRVAVVGARSTGQPIGFFLLVGLVFIIFSIATIAASRAIETHYEIPSRATPLRSGAQKAAGGTARV